MIDGIAGKVVAPQRLPITGLLLDAASSTLIHLCTGESAMRLMVGIVGLTMSVWVGVLASLSPALAQARPDAPSENRLALVIANAQYRQWDKLRNPQGDGQLIAKRLGEAKFDVRLVEDADLVGMRNALREFGTRVRQAGSDAVALLYYAGHGAQDLRSRNYLIAVDAPVENFEDQAIRLDTIQELLDEARPKISIIVLDACRNNPAPVATRGGGKRGLAVEKFTPGFFIAYSTAPGEVAEDGEPGGNSPYAAALADEIVNPASSFQEAFRKAGRRVMSATAQKQIPWTSSSPTAEFTFVAQPIAPTPPPVAQGRTELPASQIATVPGATAKVFAPDAPPSLDPDVEFQKAIVVDTTEGYEKLLARFPNHPQREAILKLIGRKHEDSLWRLYNAAGTDSDRLAVLDRLIMFNGTYAETGRERRRELLKKLELPAAPPVPPPPAIVATLPRPPIYQPAPPPVGPTLVSTMNGGRWATRSGANCNNPAEWFWMASNGSSVTWRKGQGRAFVETITSNGPASFSTIASDGASWTYSMYGGQVRATASNKAPFMLVRCS